MLTGAQLRTVAYLTDSGVVCTDCAFPRNGRPPITDEICEYSASEHEDGLYCDDCGKVISEPHEKTYTVTFTVESSDRDGGRDLESAIETALNAIDADSVFKTYRNLTVKEE